MVKMNITDQDINVLKAVKKCVEKIEKAGQLPNTLEGMQELWQAWNYAYKKNDKLSNCPTCKQTKFRQLKQTYDLFDLKSKYNKESKEKKPKTKAKKK